MLNAGLLGHATEKLQELRHFVLGQQIDLQIQVGAHVGDDRRAVLADEHEGREEDRLERHDEREQTVGKRIEAAMPDPSLVLGDPPHEPHDVDVHEPHVSGEPGEPVGQAVLQRRVRLFGRAHVRHRVDVPLNDVGERGIVGMRDRLLTTTLHSRASCDNGLARSRENFGHRFEQCLRGEGLRQSPERPEEAR